MNTKVSRKIEMGTESRDFNRKYPLASTEFGLIVDELDGLLIRATHKASEQRQGAIDQHAGALRKTQLESESAPCTCRT